MPGVNYPIITSKLGKRKLAKKESSVYWNGQLVPAAKIRKESSRHGYMTTLERLHMAAGIAQLDRSGVFTSANKSAESGAPTSPKTPAGVQICTPPSYPVFRRVFQELPILRFLRSIETVVPGKVAT